MTSAEKKCWLCLRTTPQLVLEVSNRLFNGDPHVAHRVGMKAAELLREAYLKDPPALCGRKTNALIAGAMYVACILEKEWKNQREIAEVCDITENSIRYNYKLLIRILGLEDQLLIKFEPGWGVKPYYYPQIPGGHGSAKKEGNRET